MTPSAERLWASLMEMAAIGATPKGGCNRMALTDADSEARHLLVRWGRQAGAAPIIDRLGNIGLLRPGTDPSRLPVAVGSHLDTVPTGGRFDGVYGVLAGLEILRTLHDAGARTAAPVMVIDWTNEEGARFTPPMGGAESAMGFRAESVFLATPDRDGTTTVEAELRRTGWAGPTDPALFRELDSYFEAHIEQGPVLERLGVPIGIVTHALGVAAFRIVVTGRDGHVGAPMAGRADAMAAAAEFTLAVERIALATEGKGMAAVTRIEPFPNARGNIMSRVAMISSPRHSTQEGLEAMVAAMRAAGAAIAARRGVEIVFTPEWGYPFVRYDDALISLLRLAAARHGLATHDLPTPIGHDAIHLGRVVPSAMLFIPCHGGISHDERESISPEWSEAGLKVLSDAVLARAGLEN